MRGKRIAGGHGADHGRIIPAHAGQTHCADVLRQYNADHPRTCGANKTMCVVPMSFSGSSPHMRGKPVLRPARGRGRRIIPAHAGQTHHHYRSATPEPDHPRTCGANIENLLAIAYFVGSSPHMRGKRRCVGLSVPSTRIIPAHAGQTRPARSCPRASPDHPRTCGANELYESMSVLMFGSSPHMRGKQSDSISKTHSDNTRKIRFAQSVTFR